MAEPSTASTNGTTTRSTSPGDPTASHTGTGSQPASGGIQTPAQQNISVIDRVKQSATEQFTAQKDRGIDALGSVTQAVRSSSQRLRDDKHETIAGYVDQAVDQIENWSRGIKEKSLDELAADVQRLARRQPAMFIGSAFALGLIGARFLKSSRPENTFGGGAESQRARYGGQVDRSAARDRSLSGWSSAARMAGGALETAVEDESPAAVSSRTGGNAEGRSKRSRASGPRTERS